MKLDYSGKTALVTGGNCEAALSVTGLLIEAGIHVYAGYRQEAAKKQIADCFSNTGMVTPCYLDYQDSDSVTRLFHDNGLPVDYLVDFAQGDFEALIASFDDSKAEQFFSANIFSRALLIKHVSRQMTASKSGRLIFISSTAAALPASGQGFYAASKRAAEALYKNCGLELGSKGIRSLILRPGYMDTGRGKAFFHKNRETILKKIPTRQLLTASDVATSVMFFLSDQASGYNACEITLDGGLTSGK